MLIQRLDPALCKSGYGILIQGLFPEDAELRAPFHATWSVIEPGGVARLHRHHEHEVFVITRGRGRMTVDGEALEVTADNAIAMRPFCDHELANLSDEEELVFVTLVWEDLKEVIAASENRLGACGRPGRLLITATPPTPNGDLHVGHLSGPYLGADIYKRYMQMRGVAVSYLSGADDHQSYVLLKAGQLGISGQEVAVRFAETMTQTLRGMAIELDHFARPTRSHHHVQLTERLFRQLWDQGAIVAREAPTLYCETCARFLFEAHVRGRCPHCGEACDGNACEECGRPNDCVDLVDPQCRQCGASPGERLLERLYFPLAPHEATVREVVERAAMSPHLQTLCERMLEAGLPDIPVSQRDEWGIPVPIEGFGDQRIYVWFEMAPGYLAATQELLEAQGSVESWRDLWHDPGTKVVQFFGFDNGYYHAVLFPAIFRAFDPEIRLPCAFVVNEFYRYEGSKFSTSRNHAMWGQQLLERVDSDLARFYLAWDGPETVQTNFRYQDLEATIERELLSAWSAWLSELGERMREECSGIVPASGAWTAEQERFYRDLRLLVAEVSACYEAETFSPQRAVRALCELVRRSRRFAGSERHWRRLTGRWEERRTALALELLAAKTLALCCAPVLPGFSALLLLQLGFEPGPLDGRWEDVPDFVPAGQHTRGLGEPTFQAERQATQVAVAV